MSVIFPQVPARLRRALGRFVGPAGAALFSLVLASCAGGGFGGAGDASDISGVNPVSQPAPTASGPISPASQRKVAEAVSGLDLGEETPPISPEDIAVSNDSGILDSNPFSSSAPAARSSGWGARADSTRKTQGYKAFEVAVPSENPLMTVAVWISETPPDYPEGKPEQDPEADRKFLYLRLRVFIEVGHVALVEGGGVEVLDSEVIVVEEKRPDPKPQPVCGSREFRDGEGSCSPILGADLLCPSGTMPANGLTQAELDAGLLSEARDNDLAGACEYLRRGANIEAQESEWRYHKRTALMIAATDGSLDMAKLLRTNGADVNRQGGNYHNGIDSAAPSNGNRRMPALHYAAGAGHKDFAEWLLAEGADLHALQTIERGALWEAAFWGRVDIVKLFLSSGADVNARDMWGATPFLNAAHFPIYLARHEMPRWGVSDGYDRPLDSAWPTVLSLLVSSGAEVNVRYNSSGSSALDVAVSEGNAEYAELLRGYGVRCFVQTGPLCGAVHVAVGFSTPDPVTVSAAGDGEALSDGDEVRQGATVMFTATPAAGHYVSGWSGNCAEAGEVADGLDGTAKSCVAAADSALSVRAEFSEIPSLAGPLCPSGSLSANGLTQAELDAGLVSAAGDNGLAGVCEYLRRGASVEAQEQSGRYRRTALMIAAHGGYLDLAKLLHANGADVNSRVGNGSGGGTAGAGRWNTHADTRFTALMYAAGMGGDVEMVGWLLDNGADPNLGDSRGRFPLWEAAHYGRVEVMGLLLDGGAYVHGADVWGVVPLQAAGPHYNYGRGPEWSYAATVAG